MWAARYCTHLFRASMIYSWWGQLITTDCINRKTVVPISLLTGAEKLMKKCGRLRNTSGILLWSNIVHNGILHCKLNIMLYAVWLGVLRKEGIIIMVLIFCRGYTWILTLVNRRSITSRLSLRTNWTIFSYEWDSWWTRWSRSPRNKPIKG